MVLQSEDFTQLLELCSLHNVPQQAHGKYGDNEEGKLNRLTLLLLIGWLVPVGNVGPKMTTWRGVIWPRDSLLPGGRGRELRERAREQEREREREKRRTLHVLSHSIYFSLSLSYIYIYA
jgi:hypothetical protein